MLTSPKISATATPVKVFRGKNKLYNPSQQNIGKTRNLRYLAESVDNVQSLPAFTSLTK